MNIFRNLCLLIGASCLMTQMAFAGTTTIDLGDDYDFSTAQNVTDWNANLDAASATDSTGAAAAVAADTTVQVVISTDADGVTTAQYQFILVDGTTTIDLGTPVTLSNVYVNDANELVSNVANGDVTEVVDNAGFTAASLDPSATVLHNATAEANQAALATIIAGEDTDDAAATGVLTINDNTIESANIVNGTITADDLADGSVTMSKLSTGVQQEFTNLKAGIAMQAAMTMASQGINGKKFTVNAGIGNYDSQSAIAVGLRYVLNEKTQFSFATSTPLSSDADGLLSTAAGVSFGF